MKKLLLILSLISTIATAQDADNASPLRTSLPKPQAAKTTGGLMGTYTIGGVSPDYATFAAAFADLATVGVGAPVDFVVRAGTYTEQVSLGVISGASAATPVAFHSEAFDSTTVILTFPSSTAATNNYTLQLNGADYVSFNSITIERSGIDIYSTVVELANGCDSISFMHNIFKGSAGVSAINSTGTRSCIFSDAMFSNNDLHIINNRFVDNANGIWVNGNSTPGNYATGLEITDNYFSNFYVGAFVLYQDAPIIHHNTVVRNTINSTVDYFGISLRYITGALLVVKNKVNTFTGNYGIRLREAVTVSPFMGTVANNMVQIGDAGAGRGIALEDNCTNQSIRHNTVNYNLASATGRAMNIEGTNSAGMEVVNNCFVNRGGGYAIYIGVGATTGLSGSDYNCFYSSGTLLAFFGTNLASLNTWQIVTSGMDLHAVSLNPVFVSAYDLHVNTSALDNTGTPDGTPDDIDGEPRNPVTPDIGADEFTFSGIDENGISAFAISPNPFTDATLITLTNAAAGSEFHFRLMDMKGCLLADDYFSGTTYIFQRNALPAGIYICKINATGKTDSEFVSKVVITDK
ncbi:MAG: T9SS type A sorting domain-containing protein [Bacteroidota bacterium]